MFCENCGAKIMDNSKFCTYCGRKIKTEAAKNVDIYVPINFSNLGSAVPDGEDIIYSTLCNVKFITDIGRKYWIAHVLFTNKNVYYTNPIGKKKIELIRRDLFNVNPINYNSFNILTYKFKLCIDRFHETKESFRVRSNRFLTTIGPIILKAKKDQLAFLRANINNKRVYKKRFEKNLFHFIPKLEKLLKQIEIANKYIK